MSTTIMRFLTAGLLGASIFGATGTPAATIALNSSKDSSISVAGAGSATSSVATAAPGKMAVKPVSGDEIVQLNSLQIQEISGNAVMAAQMQQVWCIKAPCPKMPTKLFTINVNASTVLLFRNRARATLSDFAVGDKINVYGFIDGANMDALIMRDLDKPQLPVKTELHNMQLIGINGNELTVQYHYECKGKICPMGVVTPSSGISSDKMMPMIFPVASTIQVSSNTKFTDRNGNAIALSDLKIGDILDIWGTTNGSVPNSTIKAQIIRDNSIPATKSFSLSISSFSGPGKLQVGQSGQWNIRLNGGNQDSLNYQISWGDEQVMAMAPQYMEKENVAFGSFTHIYQNPGTYTVQITATDANGVSATATASVYVYPPATIINY